jgi:DNA-binding NarL/FixJ family response regulator
MFASAEAWHPWSMASREAPNPVRLLVVEDSAEFRATLVGWATAHADLELVGAVATAEEALVMVGEDSPDVVVMDLALPGMSGLDAVRTLRRAGQSTPVVIVTLHDGASVRREAMAAGADAFLSKSAIGDRLHDLLVDLSMQREPAE